MEEIEMQMPDPDYLQGFNEGYLITKHLPELSGKLPASLPESERSKGFVDGKQQFLSEKEKDHYPAWLKSDRLSNLNNKTSPSKDKSRDEPER